MKPSRDRRFDGQGTNEKGEPVAVLGIDLGTTYSLVAHLDRLGRPTSIPNSDGELLTPSVVLFDADGPVVGREALLASAAEPEKVAECVKRDMGSRVFRRPINGQSLPPEVISSYILRRLRSDAERKLGPASLAVITVPAYFDEPRRRATVDAGRLAGLDVLDVLNEPTAAALGLRIPGGLPRRAGRALRRSTLAGPCLRPGRRHLRRHDRRDRGHRFPGRRHRWRRPLGRQGLGRTARGPGRRGGSARLTARTPWPTLRASRISSCPPRQPSGHSRPALRPR